VSQGLADLKLAYKLERSSSHREKSFVVLVATVRLSPATTIRETDNIAHKLQLNVPPDSKKLRIAVRLWQSSLHTRSEPPPVKAWSVLWLAHFECAGQ